MSQLIDTTLSTTKESHVDVLIIGAGPAGLMAGNALSRAGINVRIVDKKALATRAGHADGSLPVTLDIMQSYGIADEIFEKGIQIWKMAFYSPDENGIIQQTTSWPVLNQETTARWPFAVCLHQGYMERRLRKAMKEQGLEVKGCTVPTSIETTDAANDLRNPTAYANTVVLEHVDGVEENREIVHAKFVIGADGAHSWVRNSLGIKVEGDSTDAVWGVIDFLPDTDFTGERIQCYVFGKEGMVFTVPRENNMQRLYVMQTDDTNLRDPVTGRIDKNRTSPDRILAHAQKILHPYKIKIKNNRVDWWALYVVGQRVATRYSSSDRVFIAGDACHTHSPKAGQGMNASMGDTHNLSWKLAYVLRGWAKMSLLQTYELERRAFALNLVDFDKTWSRLFFEKPRTKDNEDGVTSEEFVGTFVDFNAFASGLGIRYGPSAIVDPKFNDVAPHMLTGGRVYSQVFINAADVRPWNIADLLPSDTRFKILVFGGDLSFAEDRARLETVAEQLGAHENFVKRYGRTRDEFGNWEMFDILCFSSGKQGKVTNLDFPEFFRPHYSKAYIDDLDGVKRTGGGGYAKYGIDEHNGAIVVVRPDGYIGMVTPLDGVEELNAYFAAFLL